MNQRQNTEALHNALIKYAEGCDKTTHIGEAWNYAGNKRLEYDVKVTVFGKK